MKPLAVLSTFAAMISLTGSFAACSGQAIAEKDHPSRSAAQIVRKEPIFDGKMAIALPEGFRVATKEDHEKHAKRGTTPNDLFIGPVEVRSIETEALIRLQTYDGTLADIKRYNEGTHRGHSDWERSEIVNVNGREWYVYEWKEPEPSGDLMNLVAPPDENGKVEKPDDRLRHYINYFTIVDGLVHRINFTALRDDMPNARKDFLAVFDSLAFKK